MMQSINNANIRKRVLLGSEHDFQSVMMNVESRPVEYFVEGKRQNKIDGVAPIAKATIDDLSFCSSEGDSAFQLVSQSQAGIILCKKSLRGSVHPNADLQQQLIFLDNPRLAFVQFVNRVLQKQGQEEEQLLLERQVTAASNDSNMNNKDRLCYSSPASVVSLDAKIGKNCRIGSFVVIGRNCSIGDNVRIHDRVTIGQNSQIGSNCTIQSGVTIGEDGFAYERDTESEKLEKFPHFKGVVIGNNVDICANSSIARGSLNDTIIGDGTKLDALVHIAHNVKIGKNCQLTAGTIIGGSAQLGDNCWTGLNCTIKNKVNIGNNVIVGAGACVIKDIPDSDVVAGVPAKSIKDKISTNEVFQMAGQKGICHKILHHGINSGGGATNSGGVE